MRKVGLIIVNVFFALVLVIASFAYFVSVRSDSLQAGIRSFTSQTQALEQVANRYLIAEQSHCDSWANTINGTSMTMQEAMDFLRVAAVDDSVSAHIIYADTLTGYSTEAKNTDSSDFSVDYSNYNLFTSMEISDSSKNDATLNVTRSYTNPTNGLSSVAFCDKVRLVDNGTYRDAILMHVVPLSNLKEQWVFPTSSEYSQAEIALITNSGEYVIKSESMKNSSLFEFIKSYNSFTSTELEAAEAEMVQAQGEIEIKDSHGTECILSYAPLSVGSNNNTEWIVIGLIPKQALQTVSIDWTFTAILAIALLLLLVFNIAYFARINRRLTASRAEAEAANKAKSEFLSNMSHDIRTPMNAIVGLTAIASRNVDDADVVKDSLRKITLASNHLLTLVNDVLDISKVESGSIALNPIAFSLADLTENLINIVHPIVKEKNLDFAFNTHNMKNEYLFADQLRVNQIFINILSNAVKYTPDGGSVRVDLSEQVLEDAPDTVRITYRVADTGIGMTPEFQETMYSTFKRATDTRVNKVQGTGLGLSIVKQMVDLMNGTITCQSAVNQGTTFTVTLDLPTADALSNITLPSMRTLLVDDDEDALQAGKACLKDIGMQVDTSLSGAEALALADAAKRNRQDYQLAILDWKMPEMDGVELARNLRACLGKGTPIIVVSAYDWSDIEEEALAAGVNGFVPKPLFKSTLTAKLSEVLGCAQDCIQEEPVVESLSGVSVLVAEDNDLNWEIINELLEEYGITATRCENGKLCVEKLESCAEGCYDLVFMDIQMPVMNGYEATQAIRASQRDYVRRIPIFAMTADAFSDDVSRCLKAGMNGHIAKPVDMNQVLKAIRTVKGGAK